MKLSLSMIVKDGLEDLKRLKPLVENHIDEWVVVLPPKDKAIKWAKENGLKVIVKDCTFGIEKPLLDEMLDWGLSVPTDYRIFNFAQARNLAFNSASGDYILWLDADDEPVGLDKLRKLIENTPQADVFDALYDYSRDEQGNQISNHIRERVIKNNGRFEWLGAELGIIHETIVPKNGFAPIRLNVDKEYFYVKHLSQKADQSSIRNHIALLYEYLKTHGKDPRTTYYLGTEYFNRKMWDFCVTIMQEYIKVGGWDEERYRAYLRMAEAYHQIEDYKSSRNAYLSAINELPHYPDAYLGLGESYYSQETWDKAIEFMLTGLQKEIPNTKSAIDITRYTFRPSVFLALSYLQLGKMDEAFKWFSRATKINPKHPYIKQYKELFMEAKDLDEYVRSFIKLGQISQRLYPKTLNKLAESIPEEIQDQELLLDFKRRYTKPKVWPNNSIVYFCSQAFEEWGPDSLQTGTGGSEEAVIHLTKRWAAMGYDVTVFNNCPEEKTVDGVKWVRWEKFNPRDIFNILISWRNNPYLEPKVANKKFIDFHDVPERKDIFTEESLRGVNIMVKSQYHKSLFSHFINKDNFVNIPNGIETHSFVNPQKTKNNLVWTSSYDRGLEYLLEMWADIKKEVPDATLDVYYGFNLYDKSPFGQTEQGKAWKKRMLRLLAQDGVHEHGRVNSATIAEAYKKAEIWAYPTDFPEIDCITATKAMAAGCVPITTDYAVMKERNQGIMIDGNIHETATYEEFKQELINTLKDDNHKEKIRSKLTVDNYDWDSVAKQWERYFK
jgi:glycosyltransferase involved in cell wall biosynthesis